VLQCVISDSSAPGIEANVHWSAAFEKAPVKASEFIHFSSTSQPPRLTPRINVELDVVGNARVGIDVDSMFIEFCRSLSVRHDYDYEWEGE